MFVDIGFEKNAFLHFWDAIPAALDSGVEQVDRGGKKQQKRISAKDIPTIYPVGGGSARAGDQRPHQHQGAAHHHQYLARRAVTWC